MHRYLQNQLFELDQTRNLLDKLLTRYQELDSDSLLLNLVDVTDSINDVHTNLVDISLVIKDQLEEDENTPLPGEGEIHPVEVTSD